MRVELVPIFVGVIAGLVGVLLLFDALTPDVIVRPERRRRPRRPRNRGGEAAIGVGFLCMAAAFFGRDSWNYSVLAVIVGAICVIYGMMRNRGYLSETIGRRPGSGDG